jgi:hypothetical protein
MMIFRTTPILLLLFVARSALGDNWTTPDGVVSVSRPDLSRFIETSQLPGLTIAWISRDETVKLGVVEVSIPAGMRLRQAGIEKGLVDVVKGELVESSKRQDGPHTIVTMTARGKAMGQDIYATQAVAVLNNKAYKAMAVTTGNDSRRDAHVVAFIESFRIAKPSQSETNTLVPDRDIDGQNAAHWSLHELSATIGGLGCSLLIVVLIVLYFTYRKRTSQD